MIFYMDHEKEIVTHVVIKINDSKPIKTITDKFEIHTLLLHLNVFAIHL